MTDDSMNILDFWPSTVIDLIFQHLEPKEVVTATLVHQTWSYFISTHSLVCWKGIKIQPKDNDQLQYLVGSVRRYEHIKAVNVNEISKLIEIFTKPGRHWKSVELFRIKFKSKEQIETILRVIAKSVQYLELHSIVVGERTSSAVDEAFNFPELRHFRLSYHFLDEGLNCWMNCMFGSARKLEKLHLSHTCDTNMKNLIQNATELKKLSLAGRFEDKNFFQNLALTLPSRLEYFEFNDILSSSYEDENLSHFNNFFKSQGKTLKSFFTDAYIELEEFESAFKMPNLHTLRFRGFHQNRAIVNNYLENLRRTNVPEASLQVVETKIMDQNLLELLAINARGLKVIEASDLLAINLSNRNWFPKLEKFCVLNMSEEVLKDIMEKDESERSHLEQLLLDHEPSGVSWNELNVPVI